MSVADCSALTLESTREPPLVVALTVPEKVLDPPRTSEPPPNQLRVPVPEMDPLNCMPPLKAFRPVVPELVTLPVPKLRVLPPPLTVKVPP